MLLNCAQRNAAAGLQCPNTERGCALDGAHRLARACVLRIVPLAMLIDFGSASACARFRAIGRRASTIGYGPSPPNTAQSLCVCQCASLGSMPGKHCLCRSWTALAVRTGGSARSHTIFFSDSCGDPWSNRYVGVVCHVMSIRDQCARQ